MKALSIRQPYAWLIVNGIKDVENRTWHTGYRGPVLIHAGKTYPKRDYIDDVEQWGHLGYPMRDLMLGGFVGIATITGCVTNSDSKWFSGPIGFTLTDARSCPLVPCLGALGFFDVPPEVLAQLPQDLFASRRSSRSTWRNAVSDKMPALPEQVAHVHSNGDFCADRQIERPGYWPVELFTADQLRAVQLAAFDAGLEAAAVKCDSMVYALDHGLNPYRRPAHAEACAAAIRAMKEKQ